MNAKTYLAKTFYPVSSRNPKDFVNLIRVYMDAVFHPMIYSRPEIFWQEGWHNELDADSGDPTYHGVVFNEMKGVLTSPDALMQNEMSRLLFPNTCCRYEYGGNPRHIPGLTYEKFLDCYRGFYHPSNSCIFLDGQLDIESILGILDKEYLSSYTCQDSQPQFTMQPPVKANPACEYCEISPNESVKIRRGWHGAVFRVFLHYICSFLTVSFLSAQHLKILHSTQS